MQHASEYVINWVENKSLVSVFIPCDQDTDSCVTLYMPELETPSQYWRSDINQDLGLFMEWELSSEFLPSLRNDEGKVWGQFRKMVTFISLGYTLRLVERLSLILFSSKVKYLLSEMLLWCFRDIKGVIVDVFRNHFKVHSCVPWTKVVVCEKCTWWQLHYPCLAWAWAKR